MRHSASMYVLSLDVWLQVSLVGLANFEDRLRYLDRCEELAAISNAPDLRSPTQEIIEAFEKEREALGLVCNYLVPNI